MIEGLKSFLYPLFQTPEEKYIQQQAAYSVRAAANTLLYGSEKDRLWEIGRKSVLLEDYTHGKQPFVRIRVDWSTEVEKDICLRIIGGEVSASVGFYPRHPKDWQF